MAIKKLTQLRGVTLEIITEGDMEKELERAINEGIITDIEDIIIRDVGKGVTEDTSEPPIESEGEEPEREGLPPDIREGIEE